MALLGSGAVLLVLGCALPVVELAVSIPLTEAVGSPSVSVGACALGRTIDLQIHDTYYSYGTEAGAWAARLVLAAGAALVLSAAVRRRGASAAAAVVLVLAGVWLFREIGSPALGGDLPEDLPASTGWLLYPPLSVIEVPPGYAFANSWWTWAAMGAGAFLVAGAGLLGDRRRAAGTHRG